MKLQNLKIIWQRTKNGYFKKIKELILTVDSFKDIAYEKSCKLYKMKMNYSEYALEYDEIEL